LIRESVFKLSESSYSSGGKSGLSILCPTRERPDQVLRLIDSVFLTAASPDKIEILFYIDSDDESFPALDHFSSRVKVFKGPRTWISNAHNYLYSHCEGEIVMTGADDMVFRTQGWDSAIYAAFDSIPDKIALIYGNDLGTHAGKIATHGFFHRNWIESLGTWVQPGRGSLWDLWSTENARKLGRLVFLENVVIEHVHYRQSKTEVSFDKTYSYVRSMNSSFRPEVTYKRLKRERRIDRILLSEKMDSAPKFEFNYSVGTLICSTILKKANLEKKRRVLSVTNWGILGLVLRNIFSKLKLR